MRRALLSIGLVVMVACESGTAATTTTASPAAPTTEAPGTSTTAADGASTTTTTLPPLQGLDLETVAEGLSNPLLVTAPPGDPRLFVLEKAGRVRIVQDGELLEEPFLDLSDLVRDAGEQGLLGMAFHPDYADNGRFFVHYSDTAGDTRLVEYRRSGDPARADPGSARELLGLDQPAGNHNGGMVAFGPDGYLYLGLGDGGGAGDQFGNGQRPDTLLGAILRLDVDQGDPYGIPSDNPFVDGGGAPEVWAYGLRNPWRFSFDPEAGLLYVADVGQNAWEEVNVVPDDEGGLNYGWPIMEGTHCFRSPGCDSDGLVLPVVEYPIYEEGCAVIGGFAYRGREIPELEGRYLYADLCDGWIRSFLHRDGEAEDPQEHFQALGRVLSLGTDDAGELYVTLADGRVLRLVPVR